MEHIIEIKIHDLKTGKLKKLYKSDKLQTINEF